MDLGMLFTCPFFIQLIRTEMWGRGQNRSEIRLLDKPEVKLELMAAEVLHSVIVTHSGVCLLI